MVRGSGRKQYNPGCDANDNCCHKQCLGGCSVGGSAEACYVCKNVYHEGVCRESCPEKNDKGEQLLEVSVD